MDTNTQSITAQPCTATPPAQLWIGSCDQLLIAVRRRLKQTFCKAQACDTCFACRSIDAQQHHSVRWFAPDGWYKREDLEDLFTTISLSLEEDQSYFFIIQKADCLSPACFNSLLKSIEEPPRGYYFIFLAERLNDVANTIRSRCHIQQLGKKDASSALDHPLLALFASTSKPTPYALLQALEQTQPDEQETIELVDRLLAHWLDYYRTQHLSNNQTSLRHADAVITLLKKALEEPPMPGSSPLFWKQLFLQIHG